MPARACASADERVTSTPSNSTRPVVGTVSPARQLKKVDLPAPLGPISPMISPSATARSAPRTARKLPNALETFCALSSMLNGSGKTTTLNAIAGLVQPSGGSIEWRGESIKRQPAYVIVAKGLALSPEGWRLFVSQTVEQNLRLGAAVLADKARIAALFERVYALFPRLAERRHQLAGTLSGGERQMLAL